jgi:outer membrane protein, multidrug efflux system
MFSRTFRFSRSGVHGLLGAVALGLSACAVQPPAASSLPALPAQWARSPVPAGPPSAPSQAPARWWQALQDPGLDALVQAAERSSPTLARAIARLDEERASAAGQEGSTGPSARADAKVSRGTQQSGSGQAVSSASTSLSLAWELDLFGGLRHDRAAAQQRLQASRADAQGTRLALQAQVADATVTARACAAQAAVRREDVRSRQAALRLTELRQAAGQVTASDTARARSSLAEAEINRVSTEEQCAESEEQLVLLTGLALADVRRALSREHAGEARAVPAPPPVQAALPATVLAAHPGVVSALRNADAAWEDIGSAEAARRPSVSLSALLGPSWLRAAGQWARSSSWSLAPTLGATLWDGGRSRAAADAARARHAQALASLESTLRSAVQEVENALALAEGAAERERLAQAGAAAAMQLLSASVASHQAGRMSLFELEDARRSFNNAQLALIASQRDRARAWVALAKATGAGAASSGELAPDLRSHLSSQLQGLT